MSDINREEYAICKRRGHDTCFGGRWWQCRFCGVWLREVRTIEEREAAPPESEQDPLSDFRVRQQAQLT